jgi:cholesterol oxidase
VGEVDYLVIGSGFGGSVAAAELAAAGKQVCVLERGKAYPPGSFPRTPSGIGRNFWDPAAGLQGMFNVWHFGTVSAVVSSGLGGGSLVYANVLLEKDRTSLNERYYTQPHPEGGTETWPFGYQDLAEHYTALRHFLDVQTVPRSLLPQWSPKTLLFEGVSQDQAYLAPLGVHFHDPATGRPAVGAPLPLPRYGSIFGDDTFRRTCRMIGECDVGCNEGAKSSMDHTYLSLAAHHGAVICIRTEVRTLTCDPAADVEYPYTVGCVVHRKDDEGRPGHRAVPVDIQARHVILAAGSLGTTYLMLANRESLCLRGSAFDKVGHRFSTNGDLLAFAVPTDSRDFAPTRGPVITAYRRVDSLDADGAPVRAYLEDGGFPSFMTWVLKIQDAPGILWRTLRHLFDLLPWWPRRGRDTDMGAEISGVLGSSPGTARSLPLLGMGTDVPAGTLFLSRDRKRLQCCWDPKKSASFFESLESQLRELCGRLSADFVPKHPAKRVITVHPLGGCPVDTSRSPGVVDGYGKVHGTEGLWIVDGSVMPGPIGANPSLTIAAFARRAARKILADEASSDQR